MPDDMGSSQGLNEFGFGGLAGSLGPSPPSSYTNLKAAPAADAPAAAPSAPAADDEGTAPEDEEYDACSGKNGYATRSTNSEAGEAGSHPGLRQPPIVSLTCGSSSEEEEVRPTVRCGDAYQRRLADERAADALIRVLESEEEIVLSADESESEERTSVVFKKGKGLEGLTLCHGRDTPGGHWFTEFKKRTRFRIGTDVVVDWSMQERDQGWIPAVVVEPDEEAEEQAKEANWPPTKVIYVRYEDGGGVVEPVSLNVQRVVETVAQVEALKQQDDAGVKKAAAAAKKKKATSAQKKKAALAEKKQSEREKKEAAKKKKEADLKKKVPAKKTIAKATAARSELSVCELAVKGLCVEYGIKAILNAVCKEAAMKLPDHYYKD